MVTTFMRNNPNTSENAALENPVHGPRNTGERGWQEVKVCDGNEAEEKAYAQIINHIGE
jgi:hypothetical protein